MKAAVYYTNGEPDVVRYEDVAPPVFGSHDVLIAVAAISVEGGDLHTRRLVAPEQPPVVPGCAAAGVVRAVGAAVTRISPGCHVAAFNHSGSHAELWSVPEHYVYACPEDLDLTVAATVPVAFGTADDALFEFGHLQPSQTVLIRGATGGVGIAAVQLAKAAGAQVIATASTSERAQALRSLGADHIVGYTTRDIVDTVLGRTERRGVDLLVDMAGGSQLNELTAAVRYRGTIASVGVNGRPTAIEFYPLVARGLTVVGVSFGEEMHSRRVKEMIERHLSSAARRGLTLPIEHVYALADAAQAHRHAERGHGFGRIVMHP
ncbi:zinc-binding alcohol dehydrogenase family protein [Mycolicibacterium sp. HK-90]|uniref:quinone oxidoreductase family protein n=1 Tax=Mycolicibacterium sp. HK-90 TaxID=3056937 RepID=UPI00265ADC9E|nr:zinc-binding alcohol dehydrogenase family protein [Mycolicibacterium sp. HK-90]WKG04031.1 zinc-binding alcohol dehydrogenase family protein [Mycolicibacterium sp. HK-90]